MLCCIPLFHALEAEARVVNVTITCLTGCTTTSTGRAPATTSPSDLLSIPRARSSPAWWSNSAYEFAPVSSIRSYTVNGLNQYTAVGGATHSWDANGNLTGDGASSFGYDTENRLVSGVAPRAPRSPTTRRAAVGGQHLRRRHPLSLRRGPADRRVREQRHRRCAATCTAPASMSRCCGTREQRCPVPPAATCTPITRARSWRPPRPRAPCCSRTPTTPTGFGAANSGRFSTRARRRSPSWACSTTRRFITRGSGGFCRPIRSGMRMTSTSMPMSAMIR